jgi:two-component sensor histidine kinase
MLNMQMSSIKEEADRVPFLESQSRVRAIALIHEKLYGSEDLARIPFDDYVADLVSSLRSSFREEACRVTFELDLKPVRLEVGTAIPVALILNELLSNVLKHAFPKPRQGRVRVSLLRREDNRCELAVADDGAGFPARLDLEHAGTMGLQIVSVLTRQLGASIELRRQGGTCVVLTFG